MRKKPDSLNKDINDHFRFFGWLLISIWPVSPPCENTASSFHAGSMWWVDTAWKCSQIVFSESDLSYPSPVNTPQEQMISLYYLQILLTTQPLTFKCLLFWLGQYWNARRKLFVDLLWQNILLYLKITCSQEIVAISVQSKRKFAEQGNRKGLGEAE